MPYFLAVFIFSFFHSNSALSQSSDYQAQHQPANIKDILNLNDKLAEDQTNLLSDPKATQLAQTRRCPISMPQMQYVGVFQSVEAPQKRAYERTSLPPLQ